MKIKLGQQKKTTKKTTKTKSKIQNTPLGLTSSESKDDAFVKDPLVDEFYSELDFVDVGESCETLDEEYLTVDCNFCLKKYYTKVQLNQHILKKHADWLETCDLCHISFYEKSLLNRHRSKHITRKESVLKCSLCPQAFFNRVRLINHEISHGNDREDDGLPLENDSIQSVILPPHNNEYIGFENTFPCDLCSKSYKLQVSLDRHRLTHDKVVSSDCKTCNDPRVDSADEPIIENVQSRCVFKFIYCKYCSKVFLDFNSLEKHTAVHKQNENKKKYVCKYCTKRFLIPDMLFVHFRKMHKMEKPFVCLYCDQYFGKRQEFSLHINNVHDNAGNVRFDDNFFVVYGMNLPNRNVEIQNVCNINCSSFDGCFDAQSKSFVDDLIDLDSGKLDDISLDTDCFDDNKSELVDIIAEMNNKSDIENCIVFNDEILDSVESKMKENAESAIRTEEVLKINDNIKRREENVDCDVCEVIQNNSTMSYKSSTKLFKCYLCCMKFKTKFKFDRHIKNHFINDKKLCICGVRCDTDENMTIHKEQCLKTFLPIRRSSDVTNDSDESDMDPLIDDSIVIFDAEQSSCLVVKDSTENRNYFRNFGSVEAICCSLNTNKPSFIKSSPLLFKQPVESPSPKVIVKRITQEEAASKRTFIKTISVESGAKTTNAKISIYRHPTVKEDLPMSTNSEDSVSVTPLVTKAVNDDSIVNVNTLALKSDSTILVNVNPLAHLFRKPEQYVFKKKAIPRVQMDYAAIIKKSLNT